MRNCCRNKRFIGWLALAAVVMLLDQLSKWLVIRSIPLGSGIEISAFFDLVFVFNHGAAFSFLAEAGGWQRWFFVTLAVLITGWLVSLIYAHQNEKLQPFAFSMVVGGALGNVIDRILHGAVVDFLHFHIRQYSWPAFNLADSAICLGVALMMLAQVRESRRKTSPPTAPQTPTDPQP